MRDVEFEATRSNLNWGSRWTVEHWSGTWFCPSYPKLVYRNSESVPKFEVSMRLPGLYRMSERASIDRVFLSLFMVDAEFEAARPNLI